MSKLNPRQQRMRDIGIIIYSMDTIQRRIQRQHLTSMRSSIQDLGPEYEDLTIVQMQVLKSVIAHQPITTKRLAELRNITSSAATQAVDILVNKGLVQRQQDENDRRSTLISLTPGYQERVTNFMENIGSSFFDCIFGVLTDKELTEFARICGKVVDEGENNK